MKDVANEKIKLEVKLLSDAFTDIKLKNLFYGMDRKTKKFEKGSEYYDSFNEANWAWSFFEELNDIIELNQISSYYGKMSLEEISKSAPYQMYKNILKNKDPKKMELIETLLNGNLKDAFPKTDMERNDISEKIYKKSSIVPSRRKNLSNVTKMGYYTPFVNTINFLASYVELKEKTLPNWAKVQIENFYFYLKRSEQADVLGFDSIKKLKKYTNSDIIDMIIEKETGGKILDTDELLAELGLNVNVKN